MREYNKLPGFTVVTRLDDVRKAMAAGWAKGFKIAYQPPEMHEIAALDRLSLLCLAAQKPFHDGRDSRMIMLVVEEMTVSFPNSMLPAKYTGFAKICRMGRHYGIEVIGTSQRIAEVNTTFRGNCEETVVFPQKGPLDLKAAVRELGFVSEADVMSLKQHHYIRSVDGEITTGKNSLRR